MCHELELTKINRLKIANAFRAVSRVDMSIPCVVEGQMGQAFVDALAQPTIYHGVIGPFHYFAGPSDTPQAQVAHRQVQCAFQHDMAHHHEAKFHRTQDEKHEDRDEKDEGDRHGALFRAGEAAAAGKEGAEGHGDHSVRRSLLIELAMPAKASAICRPETE